MAKELVEEYTARTVTKEELQDDLKDLKEQQARRKSVQASTKDLDKQITVTTLALIHLETWGTK